MEPLLDTMIFSFRDMLSKACGLDKIKTQSLFCKIRMAHLYNNHILNVI